MHLTKKQIKINKKERYIRTKTYAKKLFKQQQKQLWLNSRHLVIERDKGCIICGRTDIIHIHHLIPREIKELKYELNNLVCLCPLHHKYSYEISAHKNPLVFFTWLMEFHQQQFEYLKQYYLKTYAKPLEHKNNILS